MSNATKCRGKYWPWEPRSLRWLCPHPWPDWEPTTVGWPVPDCHLPSPGHEVALGPHSRALSLLSTASRMGGKASCRVAKRLFLTLLHYPPCYLKYLHVCFSLGFEVHGSARSRLTCGQVIVNLECDLEPYGRAPHLCAQVTLCCPLPGEHPRSVRLGKRVQAEGFLAPNEFF